MENVNFKEKTREKDIGQVYQCLFVLLTVYTASRTEGNTFQIPKMKKYYHSHIPYLNFLNVFVSLKCNTMQSGIIIPFFSSRRHYREVSNPFSIDSRKGYTTSTSTYLLI